MGTGATQLHRSFVYSFRLSQAVSELLGLLMCVSGKPNLVYLPLKLSSILHPVVCSL